MSREARYLYDWLGKHVWVDLDDRRISAQLDAIGPTGCYVITRDTGDRLRVAAWRITKDES